MEFFHGFEQHRGVGAKVTFRPSRVVLSGYTKLRNLFKDRLRFRLLKLGRAVQQKQPPEGVTNPRVDVVGREEPHQQTVIKRKGINVYLSRSQAWTIIL